MPRLLTLHACSTLSGPFVTGVQQFEITIPTGATTATATVSAVDPTKAAVFFGGFYPDSGGATDGVDCARVGLTNATTLTAARGASSGSYTVTVRGTVVEFTAAVVTSVQHGTVSLGPAVTSNTATITAVDTVNTILIWLGESSAHTNVSAAVSRHRLSLTNATTVTADRVTGTAATVVSFCAVTFHPAAVSRVQRKSHAFNTTSNSSETNTITAVAPSRAILVPAGSTGTAAGAAHSQYRLSLTSGTTVTLTRGGSNSSARVANFAVVEFAAGVLKSVQRGTAPVAGGTTFNTAIAAVDTAKAVALCDGYSTDGAAGPEEGGTVKLTSATNMRSQLAVISGNTLVQAYEVAEFA